jgi:hypothetical protein
MVTYPKSRRKTTAKESPNSKLDIQESLAAQREKKLKQQKLTLFSLSTLAWAVFLGLPLGLIFQPVIGVAVGLGIPALAFSFLYPRTALWIFLIFMPFNGTLTYWVAGGNSAFQLAKDLIYFPALFGLILQCRKKRLPLLIGPPSLHLTLQILIICTLLTFFVVNVSFQLVPVCSELITRGCRLQGIPIAQGLLGFKIFLGYIPLIFCMYYLIEEKKHLIFLGRLLVVLAIICCGLALVQYWYLYTGKCQGTRGLVGDELFKASLNARCFVGGSLIYSPEVNTIRLPGTFGSPWHWGWFLIGNAGICFAAAFSDPSKLWRLISLIGLGLVTINAIICGQRLSFIAVPVLIIILLLLTGKFTNLKQFIPIAAILTLLLWAGLSLFNPEFIQARIDSFVGRWNHTPPHLFIQEQFIFGLRYGAFIGRGVGYGTSSARIFGDISFIETYHPKVLFEIGVLGVTAYMVFLTHLVYTCFRAYRSLKDLDLRSFASSFWVIILVITYLPYWYPLDTDPISIYYWMFAGVILRLPVIDKQEKEKLLTEVDKNPVPEVKFKRKKFSLL